MRTPTVSIPRQTTPRLSGPKAGSPALGRVELCPEEKVVCIDARSHLFHNPHVGDDARYCVVRLRGGEDALDALPQLLQGRQPQFTPAAHDGVERLAALAGLAVSRTDILQMETAFVLLERRLHAALMPAERVLILEAMYHACGYEGLLLYSALKRRCDQLFDELIPTELATARLLFCRYCPSPLAKSVSRDTTCRRWLRTLSEWLAALAADPSAPWASLPLDLRFHRLRYLYRTGTRHLVATEAEALRARTLLRSVLTDALLTLRHTAAPDARTLAAAYFALREFTPANPGSEPLYAPLMQRITALQSSLNPATPQWLTLEELLRDYAALTAQPIPLRLITR